MNIERIAQAVDQCIAAGGRWVVGDHLPEREIRGSRPWVLFDGLGSVIDDPETAHVATALTCAFSARRSLACWFLYCDDTRPLQLADRLISAIPGDNTVVITRDDTRPCEPTENGVPITDCRQVDTLSASTSVARAAAYFLTRNREHAVFCLAVVFCAFSESPIAPHDYEERMLEWLLTVAIPAAAERRELTLEEQAALADFSPFLLRR
jgi:hypothetical protein